MTGSSFRPETDGGRRRVLKKREGSYLNVKGETEDDEFGGPYSTVNWGVKDDHRGLASEGRSIKGPTPFPNFPTINDPNLSPTP